MGGIYRRWCLFKKLYLEHRFWHFENVGLHSQYSDVTAPLQAALHKPSQNGGLWGLWLNTASNHKYLIKSCLQGIVHLQIKIQPLPTQYSPSISRGLGGNQNTDYTLLGLAAFDPWSPSFEWTLPLRWFTSCPELVSQVSHHSNNIFERDVHKLKAVFSKVNIWEWQRTSAFHCIQEQLRNSRGPPTAPRCPPLPGHHSASRLV